MVAGPNLNKTLLRFSAFGHHNPVQSLNKALLRTVSSHMLHDVKSTAEKQPEHVRWRGQSLIKPY